MTNNEAKAIIINNQMTYNDFANYFNISIDSSIEIFQHLDLKRCSKKENCVNSAGPIQSRRNFHNDKSRQDGLGNQCIYCSRQKSNRYRQNNLEHCRKKSRQYRQDNKDHLNQYNRQYHQDNKEHRNQLSRQYRRNNKEYFDQKTYQYRYNNLEHYKQKVRQYHQNNKEYRNQLVRQHYHNNKEYLIQKTKEYYNSYAKFDTFNHQISYAEKTQRDPNNSKLIQVKCAYCNLWFNPTNRQVQARINALEGKNTLGTENRFYCSYECKESCPIYGQHLYSKDNPKYYNNLGTSREVQSELRQLVFERDNWTCQRCNTYKDSLAAGISLHCHHKEGIRWESVESADIGKCITVCSKCHKEIHKIPGCTYQDFQCKPEERVN